MLGIRLDGKKEMSLNKDLYIMKSPKFIYIPLSQGNMNYTTSLKVDDKVKIGTKIGVSQKYDIPIFSSISGNVVSVDQNRIKIENDFKEEFDYESIENKVNTKEEFIEIVKNKGIVGLSGSSYPTYLKYKDNNISSLIINAIECEPYNTSDYFVSVSYADEIITTLNLIVDIFNIKECFIAIKGKNKYLKEIFNTKLENNKAIKLVTLPDLYPIGWSRNLVRYIKHTDYDKHTIEKGIIVNNISTIYSIYEAIFLNKPLIERIITFTGEGLNNPCNVKVKFGTMINEVIEFIGGYKENKVTLISSGPMMGYNLEVLDPCISSLTSVIALFKCKNYKQTECIRCGKCIENCPAKIYPVLIKDNIKNKEALKKLFVDKCIRCGICSYICPAKINLREYVEKARGEINDIRKK